MRHPGGMAAEKDSRCETSGWNGSGEGFHPGGMSDAARRKGGRLRVQGRESHVAFFLERVPQVGESLERETGLVDRMDMEAWVSGFNGYAKE